MGRGPAGAWLVAAALLASWAVSSASNERRIVTPGRTGVPRALPDAARAVEVEAARLAGRRHAPPAAGPAGQRDPFAFDSRHAGAPPRVADRPGAAHDGIIAAVPMAAAPAPPADPVPVLAGVAELGTRGVVAVISYTGDLHYVSRGDVIGGRYRVDAIDADGVNVFDLMLGTNSRLLLQRP